MNVIFIQNLMIFNLLIYATHNKDNLFTYPVSISLINHSINQVPGFLKDRKEIGFVLQRQFEDLEICRRYVRVGLYFDGMLHFVKIDLSTIYAVEVENVTKLSFDSRIKFASEYLKEVMHLSELEYLNKINHVEQILLQYGGDINSVVSKVDEKLTTKIIDVADVILENNNK